MTNTSNTSGNNDNEGTCTLYIHHFPLTHMHLAAIGLVTSSWTLLEGTIEAGIWGFSSLSPQQGQPLTARMGIRQRLETIMVVAHQKLPDEASKSEFKEIIDSIDSLRERRNDIVHANWKRSDKLSTAIAMKYKWHKPNKLGDWKIGILSLPRFGGHPSKVDNTEIGGPDVRLKTT